MNNPTGMSNVRSAIASAANSFQPSRVRFKYLEPFKDEICDLRKRGAAFVTIAEILKSHSIKASREAVRQFYREMIEGKVSRQRSPHNTSKRKQEPQQQRSVTNEARVTRANTTKTERGPRIARIEDL